MINYYDQAVVVEHNFLSSINDKLTTIRFPSTEQSEMDNFATIISLKQEPMRTKLGKRRVTKIQKLLHPRAERAADGGDVGPRRKKKTSKEEA